MGYVRTRLGRLFYEEHGSGPPIVLMHGLFFDGAMWRGQIEPLAALGRVVVVDGPGHGRSEAPPRFTLEDGAEAMVDVCNELGIARAIFVGLSWGAMTAMHLALRHPSLVRALALLDTSAEQEGLSERLRYRAFVELYLRLGAPYALFRKEVAPLLFGPTATPDLIEATYRRVVGFERIGVANATLAVSVHRRAFLDRLGKIAVPTLVICGSEDRSTPLARSEAIARAIEKAELRVLRGLGHMTVLEDPKAVNAVLVPWVSAAAAAAREH